MSRLWRIASALMLMLGTIIALIAIPGANLPRRVDSHGLSQVWVPSGCFKMGSDPTKGPQAEWPIHKVCLTHGYWIDEYDVTNIAFAAFVDAGGYNTDEYWSADGLAWKQSNNIIHPVDYCQSNSNDPHLPRMCVTWYEAVAYANWRTKTAKDGLLYRLPTEAEWEYAARGPLNWIFPWGNVSDGSKANTWQSGVRKLSPVGSYPAGASWVGAQDMVGNVYQWVLDWYDDGYYQSSPMNNPTGPTNGTNRVLRGGSWSDDWSYARSAFRVGDLPDSVGNFGIRLVGIPSE